MIHDVLDVDDVPSSFTTSSSTVDVIPTSETAEDERLLHFPPARIVVI